MGRLRALFRDRSEVSGRQLELGRKAWRAFTSPNPGWILEVLREDTSDLPFLEGALLRHLQQLPSVENGLSHSETQNLNAALDGRGVLREAFVASCQEQEERIFLGDSIFATYLTGLSGMGAPLLLFEDGAKITAPHNPAKLQGFLDGRAVVTEGGRAILEGRSDRIETRGIDRWLGGIHLRDSEDPWRWEESARRLRRRDVA